MGAKECDNLIDYLTGELPDSQAVSFKKHLNLCQVCKLELEDLQDTWFALSYDREDKEAPQSLKAEVLSYAFEKPSKSSLPLHLLSYLRNGYKTIFSPFIAGMIAVLLICVIGLGWNDIHIRKFISNHEEVSQKGPISIKNTYILQPQSSFSKAKGVVYLVNEGKQERLIMELDHIPPTKGTEVYQAWLLYEGRYLSCGTFQSNQSGEGVLTYLIPSKVQVKGFEITLEPNSNANQPHGQTIMKTF
jgi:hypothetical protein